MKKKLLAILLTVCMVLSMAPAALAAGAPSATAEEYAGAYGGKASVIGATFTVDEKAAAYDGYQVYYQVMFDRNVFIDKDNETKIDFGYAADTKTDTVVAPITGYADTGHNKDGTVYYLSQTKNIIRNSDPVEIDTGYTYADLSAGKKLTIALFDGYNDDTLDAPSGLPTGTRAAINLILKSEGQDDVVLGHYTGMVGELPKVIGTTYGADIMGVTVPAVHFQLSNKAVEYFTAVGSLDEDVLKNIMGEDGYAQAVAGWEDAQSEGFSYEYYMGAMAIQLDAASNNSTLASVMGSDYLTMEEIQNLAEGGAYPTMANWLADVEVTFTSDTLTSVENVMVILYAGNTLNASGSNIVGGKEFVDTPLVIGETYRVIEGTVSTVTSFSNYTYGVRSGAVVNLSELMQLTSGASIAAVRMATDGSVVALPEGVEMNVEVKLYPNDADRAAGGWASADPRNGEFSSGGFGGSGVSANYELEWAYLYGNANYDKLIELNEAKYGANNIFTRYYPEGEGPFTYLENYAWDGGYSYTVWPAENEADPPAEPDPLPPVDPEPLPEPEVSTGAPSVTIPDNLELTDEHKEAIENTAESISIPALNDIAGTLIVDDEKVQAAVEELKGSDIEVSDNDTVSIHVQAYLDITPSAYTPSADGTPGTLTLDITPKSRLIATTAENAEDIKLVGEDQNAIVYGNTEEIAVTTSVTITVELPEGFAISDSEGGYYPIKVTHRKDNGSTYEYRANVNADGKKATFENPNGFSTFSFAPMSSYPVELPDYDSHELTDNELTTFFAGSDYEALYDAMTNPEDNVLGLNFTATETYEDAVTKSYADYNADFVLTSDKDATVLLLGNYGEWGTIGFIAELDANEPFRVIADSKIGETYGKQPYKGVVKYVGDFDCVAIPITDEVKAAYKAATGKTDLDSYTSAEDGTALALALNLYETEPFGTTTRETGEFWMIGEEYSFVVDAVTLPEYDSHVLSTEELTAFFAGSDYETTYNALANAENNVFGMNFTATESYEEAVTKSYADYNADFVLTSDKDATVLLLGNYGEYGTVGFIAELEAGEPFRVIADSVIGETYGKQPYKGVVRYVGDFDCVAVPITNEVKAAYKAATGNTDLDGYASAEDDTVLTLALNLYETEPFGTTTKETGKAWIIGSEYSFRYLAARVIVDGVSASTAAPSVTVPETADIDEEHVKEVTDAVAGTTITGLESIAHDVAADVTDEEAEAAANVLKESADVTVNDGESVTIHVQTYLDIQPTAYTPEDGESETDASLTLDITPMSRLVASTEEDAEDIILHEDEGTINAVVVPGSEQEVEVTETVTLTVPLPNGFANVGDTLYITHTKDDGSEYVYEGIVSQDIGGQLYVTFENPHGFSIFTITTKDPSAAKIGDIGYTSFAAAVNAVENGGIINVVNDCTEEAAAVVSKDISFTVLAAEGIDYNLEAGNNTTMTSTDVEGGKTYTFDYTAPYVPPVAPPSNPSYRVTVEETVNGNVTVSTSYATAGQTVTITVDPDKGYVLETLTVTDKNGNEIELTGKGSGKYTFKMPASKVTIEATFMEDNTMLNYFVDVFASDYYYDAVLWAVENDITNGTSDTTFSPNAVCTRAQVVTFLWRAAGEPAPKSAEMPFSDVAEGAYYYDAVLWAVENGITNGTSATTFSPDADCTRGQIVTFLWRSQGSENATANNPFVDVADGAYYEDAVLWAVANDITNGTSANTFSPDADCTRGQIVTFLYRCLAE